MNDIEFIETLKQKRNACDYSQSRLAQELQISRQNLNEIENGKTKASNKPDWFDLVEWVLFDTHTESVYESEVDKIYNK